MRTIILVLVPTNLARAQLTWSLAGGGASLHADKRAAIVAAMDEAVALYNANGYFPKTLRVNDNASIPAAQASYPVSKTRETTDHETHVGHLGDKRKLSSKREESHDFPDCWQTHSGSHHPSCSTRAQTLFPQSALLHFASHALQKTTLKPEQASS